MLQTSPVNTDCYV